MKYRLGFASLAVLAFVLLVAPLGSAATGSAASSWPMYQHRDHHTGKSTVSGPSGSTVSVAWTHVGQSWIKNQPAIEQDGLLYALR